MAPFDLDWRYVRRMRPTRGSNDDNTLTLSTTVKETTDTHIDIDAILACAV